MFVCLFVWPLRYQETREVGEVRYFTGGWLRLRMVNKNELQLIWGWKDPENCGIRVLDRWIKLLFEKSRTCSSAVIARVFAYQKWCFEWCEGLGRTRGSCFYEDVVVVWAFLEGGGSVRWKQVCISCKTHGGIAHCTLIFNILKFGLLLHKYW